MAYRRTARKSTSRRSYSRSPARKPARRAPVRRAARSSGRHQTVKIVIQHEQAPQSSPGGLENPQVQSQTKKGKF